MISKYSYEKSKQKYQNVVQYTNNHPNILDTVKKDIKQIMEKYRIAISCMEEQDIYDLIEKCAIDNSSKPLHRELQIIIFGNSYVDPIENDDRDNSYYNDSDDRDVEYYNE